jgi:hypothetical protein
MTDDGGTIRIARGKRVVEVTRLDDETKVAVVYGTSALTAYLGDTERRQLIEALGGEVK